MMSLENEMYELIIYILSNLLNYLIFFIIHKQRLPKFPADKNFLYTR